MHPLNSPIIRRTVVKMLRSQAKKKEIIEYILEHHPDLLANPVRRLRVRDCCNVLRFVNYGEGKSKLYKANFCKYDKFCLACATRRSIKKIQQFVQGIYDNWLEKKNWYHITLTIRHKKHHSLEELLDRIMAYKKELSQSVRNSKRKTQKKESFFAQFDGIVSSIEVTYTKKNGRHPHIYTFLLALM